MSAPSSTRPARGVGARVIDVNADRLSRCDDAIRAFRADDVLSPSVLTSGRLVVRAPPSLVQYTSKTRFDHPAQESMIKLKSPLLRSSVVKMSYTEPPPPARKPPAAKSVAVSAKPPAVKPPAVKNVAQPFNLAGIPKPVIDQLYSDIDVAIIAEVTRSGKKVIETLDLEPMEAVSSSDEDFLDGVPEYKPSDAPCESCVQRGKVVMVSAATQCDSVVSYSVATQIEFNEVEGSGGDVPHRYNDNFPNSSYGNPEEPPHQYLNNPSYSSVAPNTFPAVKNDSDAQKDEGFQVKIAELSMQYEMFKASLNSDSGVSSTGRMVDTGRFTAVQVNLPNKSNSPAQQASYSSGVKPDAFKQLPMGKQLPPERQKNSRKNPMFANPVNPSNIQIQLCEEYGQSYVIPNPGGGIKNVKPQQAGGNANLNQQQAVGNTNFQPQAAGGHKHFQAQAAGGHKHFQAQAAGSNKNFQPQVAGSNKNFQPQTAGGNHNFKQQLSNSKNAPNAADAPEPTFKQSFNKVSEACTIPSAFGGGNFFPSNPSPLVLDTKQYPFQLNPYTRTPLTSPGQSMASSETPTFSSYSAATSFPSQSSFIQPPGRLQLPVNDGQSTFHVPSGAFGAADDADPFNIMQKKPYGSRGSQTKRGKW